MLLRRYVHGTAQDDPLLWYEGAGLGDRRSLQVDHEGSVVSVADGGGNALALDSYDEYGTPGLNNAGRFQYTGQAWLPALGMSYYKARLYAPKLGRFLQTDPVGYKDQVNLYAYVANDPVNGRDPTGQDSITCNVVDGKTSGCTLTPDKKDTTSVTINDTRNYTGSDGKQYSSTQSYHSTYQGSISQEGLLSKAVLGVGDQILKSVGDNLSGITGTQLSLSVGPASESSGNGLGGADALGAIGGGRQFNGRPGANTAQNRQVNDAAREAGLNAEQRRQLGRAVEAESRQGGANLGYHDIKSIAESIKSGHY